MSRSWALVCALLPLAAAAQPIEPTLLGGSPDARVRLDEINGELEAKFRAALSLYDAEVAAQPYRIRAQITRCEFVEAFPLEYEYVTFSDELYELGGTCEQDLVARFPDHPDVRLWQLSRTYGDEERLAAAQNLLPLFDVHGWTRGQRARLYTELANVSERLDTARRFRERTADYARRALDHDLRADVRLVLGAYFKETGDPDAALEALTSPFDGHDPKDNWYVVRKMTFLAELGARDAVRAGHAKLADNSSYYDRSEAAAALRAVGEIELARRELAGEEGLYFGRGQQRQRFLLALEGGTAEEAHAAYEQWRDGGWREDPIGVNRFALFVAHPGLPWRARDALALVGAFGFAALLCTLWCVPLGLIHYRGLVNRLRSSTPYDHGDLQLRHAWWGLAALMLATFVSFYAVGPLDLFTDTAMPWAIAAEQPQLAKLLLVESIVALILLALVAGPLRRHFAQWWSTDWPVAKCLLVGTGVALALRLPMIVLLAGVDLSRLPLDNAMLRLLREVHELYGPAAAFWVLTAAAPVAEEFIFRGLLLRAALRHISFPAANTVQALLFSALHFDLAAAPYLFVCGLAFGWLARRSGGLLAPMVAHAVFNLAAAFLVTS